MRSAKTDDPKKLNPMICEAYSPCIKTKDVTEYLETNPTKEGANTEIPKTSTKTSCSTEPILDFCHKVIMEKRAF